MDTKDWNWKKEIQTIFFLIVTATLFLLIFSLSTSVFYRHKFIGWDSDIFLAMGKFAQSGQIPYKDFFDHKGPVIIGIQCLGYIIGNGKPGVFVIQTIFLCFSLGGIYKILRLFYRRKISLCLTVCSLLIFNIYFDKGNLTEEYCLPFLTWSIYFGAGYFLSKTKEHKWTYAVLYGITFMMGAMTRLTNALPVIILVMIITVVMVRAQVWTSIVKNAAGFIVGIFIVLIPILVYFVKVHGLEEMLYATFFYNIKHGFERAVLSASEICHMILLGAPLAGAVLTGVGVIFSRRTKTETQEKTGQYLLGVTVLCMGIAALILLKISRPYAHYFVIWVPLIVLSFGLVKDLSFHRKKICIVLILLCSLAGFIKLATTGMEIISVYHDKNVQTFERETEEIVSQIPRDDRNQVIVYNAKVYVYLITDIIPCYKNFTLQDLHTGTDKREQEEFIRDLKSMRAKYIITGAGNGAYHAFIKEHYRLVKRTQTFRLFQRK